jgi:hypothetical protein
MIELFDYQQEHAKTLFNSLSVNGVAKDGSDCGTGKTPVASWVASQYRPDHCVIVCPKILVPSWTEWIEKAGVGHIDVINYEKLRTGNHPLIDRKKLQVYGKRKPVEYFKWKLRPNPLLIWDEDHMISGQNTLNSKMSRAASVQKIPQLYLGATSADGPHKMWALGCALGFHNGSENGFKEWAMEMGCFKNMFRELQYRRSPETLKHLHDAIYGGDTPKGSRIRIKELGDKFPSNQIFTELYRVDESDQIQKCYEELEEELNRLDEKEEVDYDSELTLRLRARQRVELYKLPLIQELIEKHLEEGLSIPVFLSFRDSVFALSERLTKACINHSVVTGGMKEADQQDMLGQFQRNEVRVIILVDSAGGVGIDLHDTDGAYRRCALVNLSDNPVIFKQTLGRTVRATGKSPVIQKVVCAEGTAEENVYVNLRAKLQRISVINDADISEADLDPIQRKGQDDDFIGELS